MHGRWSGGGEHEAVVKKAVMTVQRQETVNELPGALVKSFILVPFIRQPI